MARSFLNSKQKKVILKMLINQFSYEDESLYHLIKDKDDLYMINSSLEGLDLDKLRIRQIGIRVGKINDDKIILSIQGSQLLGPKCNDNIIDVSVADRRLYLKGEDLESKYKNGIYLLRCDNTFFGCSKLIDGVLRNNIERYRQIDCAD